MPRQSDMCFILTSGACIWSSSLDKNMSSDLQFICVMPQGIVGSAVMCVRQDKPLWYNPSHLYHERLWQHRYPNLQTSQHTSPPTDDTCQHIHTLNVNIYMYVMMMIRVCVSPVSHSDLLQHRWSCVCLPVTGDRCSPERQTNRHTHIKHQSRCCRLFVSLSNWWHKHLQWYTKVFSHELLLT